MHSAPYAYRTTAPSRYARRRVALLAVCAVLAAGGVLAVAAFSTSAHARRLSPASTPAAPLRVIAVGPSAGATNVTGSAEVTVKFSAPLAAHSPLPAITPRIPGRWERHGPAGLRFLPSAAALPLSTETLTIPGGAAGVRGAAGGRLRTAVHVSWQVRNGSVLAIQQVLARLGYLPLTWTPDAGQSAGTGSTQGDLAAFYAPPAGRFAWRYQSTPRTLRAAWTPGVDNRMTAGAIVAFERRNGLPAYSSIRSVLWPVLLTAERNGTPNPEGYTYALVSQAQPESLTLWHDGRDVFTSVANTGIAATPTPVGTFFIYLRFASTTMQGQNPNGSYYVDHGVRWVNYFDGGDAIHGFIRATYGFPQSLGCVELPVSNAAVAWHWLHYGTLVTVLPA